MKLSEQVADLEAENERLSRMQEIIKESRRLKNFYPSELE